MQTLHTLELVGDTTHIRTLAQSKFKMTSTHEDVLRSSATKQLHHFSIASLMASASAKTSDHEGKIQQPSSSVSLTKNFEKSARNLAN